MPNPKSYTYISIESTFASSIFTDVEIVIKPPKSENFIAFVIKLISTYCIRMLSSL
jgi:hypothetical protein